MGEKAERLGDKRQTVGSECGNCGSNYYCMSLILMLCEKNNDSATKLTAYASNYKA